MRCNKCFNPKSDHKNNDCPKFIISDKIKLLYCSVCIDNTAHKLSILNNKKYYKCISHN